MRSVGKSSITGVALGLGIALSLGGANAGAVTYTIAATALQSNFGTPDAGPQLAPLTNGPVAPITSAPWNFSSYLSFYQGQGMVLSSITSISLTMTMVDGDTGTGANDFDRNNLRLQLGDGSNYSHTGVLLNDYDHEQVDTVTNSVSDWAMFNANANTILASLLNNNGLLYGAIWDRTTGDSAESCIGGCSPYGNYIGLPGELFATLTLTGDLGEATVPEPGTVVLFVTGLSGLMAWRMRKSQA